MDEIVDFASLLIKLVILLAVVLMAVSWVIVPHRALVLGESMLILVVPLCVLTMVLDLVVSIRRSSGSARSSLWR